MASDKRLAPTECSYLIRKLQARYFAGDYASAIAACRRAEPMLSILGLTLELAEYHFYGALSLAATCEVGSAEPHAETIDILRAHQKQLAVWAENCPENFENRALLVGAEIARIESRELDAERLYEQAIRSAHKNSFIHNEAVASELAGRFHLSRGFERIANTYFREARRCYLRWGADGKVVQLDRLYPHLVATEYTPLGAIIGSQVQHLDVVSVVKASQALSGEIVLPKLIEQLMKIAIENAGADRGLLILPAGDEFLIEAEALTIGEQLEVTIRPAPMSAITCPVTLIRYVIRTRERVLLDDASKSNLFSNDEYFHERQSRSILCLPLVKQGELTGILLLENTLTSHVFTKARIAILELLAAQAAISLENTRLYGDLREREAKVRRLVDANIIGILIIDLGGRLIEANDAFLNMVGYDRADLLSGHMLWTDLTPPEWQASDAERVDAVNVNGSLQPFEKEYFHKDGGRVPVLVGVARFDETGSQAVAFVIDLTSRKRAEAELAHANRVATMGQLTATIAHEVNQPIAALVMNAGTAARWLDRQPPQLKEARPLLDDIIRDGKRAADIVRQIRDFSKKASARTRNLEINTIILEVMGITRAIILENAVLARTQLSERLPLILGDKVQLQQVIMNLVINSVEAMSEMPTGARELHIRSSELESGDVLVAVSDTGPGLPQASPERVFEAFYTTKSSGLGMGLSICRSIVEAHGGRLLAKPNEQLGATFSMILPTGN
jgi:PAS domain S-box-containing protein